MRDIEIQLGQSNIADVVLKSIRKYLGKKKHITKEGKEQYKCYFEKGVFIIEKLVGDGIERCKLRKAIGV